MKILQKNNLFLLIILFCSCCRPSSVKIPEEVAKVLDKAGHNRKELEKVINHYNHKEADSLKLKAAFFLIKNLEDSYYYEGETLENYHQYSRLVRGNTDKGVYIHRKIDSLYGPFHLEDLDKKMDIETVKAHLLIENIDLAFKALEEQPWKDEVSFDDFCEYILPYRVGDEKPEYLRKEFYETFKHLQDSVREKGGGTFEAVQILNSELMKGKEWLPSSRMNFLPHFPVSQILKHKVGTCREMCDLGLHVMRSQGIPVAIDFVLQWPDAQGGHSWNRVILPTTKNITYLGAREGPDTINRRPKMAKVYRHMYSKNTQSLAILKGKDATIPYFFKNPHLKDVTAEYSKVFNVTIPLDNNIKDDSIIYLSVFDNERWIPISWTQVQGQKAIFKNHQGGVTYLPTFFSKSGEVIPAGYPFILDEKGRQVPLKPNYENMHNPVSADRIFPMYPPFYKTKKLIGGVFEGANKSDFSDAVVLYEIKGEPLTGENQVPSSTIGKYRYVRYLSAPNQHNSIAEIKFISDDTIIKGKPIGTPGSKDNHPRRTLMSALDGDVMTFYEADLGTGSWVGYDFGQPVALDEIIFSAMYHGEVWTQIVPGNEYELFYWRDTKGWHSLGKKTATKDVISFSNVPSNALYLLKSNSRSIRERIFTYEGGKQIWR